MEDGFFVVFDERASWALARRYRSHKRCTHIHILYVLLIIISHFCGVCSCCCLLFAACRLFILLLLLLFTWCRIYWHVILARLLQFELVTSSRINTKTNPYTPRACIVIKDMHFALQSTVRHAFDSICACVVCVSVVCSRVAIILVAVVVVVTLTKLALVNAQGMLTIFFCYHITISGANETNKWTAQQQQRLQNTDCDQLHNVHLVYIHIVLMVCSYPTKCNVWFMPVCMYTCTNYWALRQLKRKILSAGFKWSFQNRMGASYTFIDTLWSIWSRSIYVMIIDQDYIPDHQYPRLSHNFLLQNIIINSLGWTIDDPQITSQLISR